MAKTVPRRGRGTKRLTKQGKRRPPEKRKAAEALRRGYQGFCPLENIGGVISGGGGFVERKHWTDLDPEEFFEYVKSRRPLVISTEGVTDGPLGVLFGLKGESARWALPGEKGMQAMMESEAARCEVVVERRADSSSFFGQSDDTAREKRSFGQFCNELLMGNELSYLTTQALEDNDGCPKSLAADYVFQLLSGSETLRPKLIGNLIPVQYNMWLGRSSSGSSSGLHHDFHDNIYVLLRGQKEFRLFSPRCLDILAPVGVENGRAKLHSNGLITYVSGLRKDGAPTTAVREWQKTSGQNTCCDSDEEELEQMLNDACFSASEDETPNSKALPDSFCRQSTMSNAQSSISSLLQGRHLTAKLKPGEMLYLPASWFHEVVSYGGDAGGHFALNIWMAPPSGSLEKPYEDDFWEAFFQKLLPDRTARSQSSKDAPEVPKAKKAKRKFTKRRNRLEKSEPLDVFVETLLGNNAHVQPSSCFVKCSS